MRKKANKSTENVRLNDNVQQNSNKKNDTNNYKRINVCEVHTHISQHKLVISIRQYNQSRLIIRR